MRVLVVDDSRDASLILSKLLGLKGHQVESANSGEEAIKVATEFRPEAIFIDLWMPRMNGYELAKRLRQIDGLENARLIAHTGANPEPHRDQEAGIDRRLTKPATLEQILEAMGCD